LTKGALGTVSWCLEQDELNTIFHKNKEFLKENNNAHLEVLSATVSSTNAELHSH